MRSKIWTGAWAALFALAVLMSASLVTSGAVADGGEGYFRGSYIGPETSAEARNQEAYKDGFRKGLAQALSEYTGRYSPEQYEEDERTMERRNADPQYDEFYRQGVAAGLGK